MPTEFVDADNKNVYFVPAIEQLAWYQRAPVAAWVYEVCFDAPIDPSSFKDLLAQFALVAALSLSLVMTAPGSLDAEKLAKFAEVQMERNYQCGLRQVEQGYIDESQLPATARGELIAGLNHDIPGCGTGGGSAMDDPWGYQPPEYQSDWIGTLYMRATVTLATVVFSSVLLMVQIDATSFRNSQGNLEPGLVRAWWWSGRWSFIIIISLLIIGEVMGFQLWGQIAQITSLSYKSYPHTITVRNLTYEFQGSGLAHMTNEDVYTLSGAGPTFAFSFLFGQLFILSVASVGIQNKNKAFLELQPKPGGESEVADSANSVTANLSLMLEQQSAQMELMRSQMDTMQKLLGALGNPKTEMASNPVAEEGDEN